MTSGFRRDRLTWIVYVVAGWFAYLQAAPGLIVPHLREELDLSYSVGGLHVAAFAAGAHVDVEDVRACHAEVRGELPPVAVLLRDAVLVSSMNEARRAIADGGAYVNFLGDEGPDRVRQAYPGPTWDRLVEIKRRYDPGNLFRLNQNIPPR